MTSLTVIFCDGHQMRVAEQEALFDGASRHL